MCPTISGTMSTGATRSSLPSCRPPDSSPRSSRGAGYRRTAPSSANGSCLVPVYRFFLRETMNLSDGLLLARLEPLGGHTPRRHRVPPTGRMPFAAAERVVDRVHRVAADVRPATTPALPSRLADPDVLVLYVPHLAHRGAAVRCTSRVSPDGSRNVTYLPSFATTCTEAPALRAICPPLPGRNSTLCTWVPRGMFRSGIAFPGTTSTRSPRRPCRPPQAERMQDVSLVAVRVDDQRDPGRPVRVVLDRRHATRHTLVVAAYLVRLKSITR